MPNQWLKGKGHCALDAVPEEREWAGFWPLECLLAIFYLVDSPGS